MRMVTGVMRSWLRVVPLGALALLSVACIVEEVPTDHEESEGAAAQDAAPIACMTHTACPSGYMCGFASGTCGQQGGVCQPAGSVTCTGAPVCGCDGVDYPDACTAWQGGVSTWFEGSCAAGQQTAPPPPPPPQDCATGCDAGEFCFSEDGSCGASAQGICREMSGVCTSSTTPVCGCDGVTYEGICDAVQQGVSVAYSGSC